jgi:dihydrofolate synthase/folylpolyglutamate synthase
LSFQVASDYLDSLGIDAMKRGTPSLHRIEAICAALNHPERTIPALHITGTNGKTSIARIATSVLAATGLSVGTYTSPHLDAVTERIALSGVPVDEEVFGSVFGHLWPYLQLVENELGERLTYFEVLTAMYFLWAAEQPVDASVVEVGLGGRWDATNVVPATVGVVSVVGLDHTGLLGMERETIAREKAGIAKPSEVIVTGERTPSVLSVIIEEATAVGASVSAIDRDFALTENRVALGGRYLSVRTSARSYDGLFLSLHGSHQGTNAAIALEAATRFVPGRPLDREVVQEAFSTTVVPGRLEAVTPEDGQGPTVIFDVAHNPDGAAALVNGLTETFAFERIVFVLGVLADKDYRGMLAEFTRLPCAFVVTQPRSVRAASAEALAAAARELGAEAVTASDVGRAVAHAMGLVGRSEVLCVTGSHYVVAEARAHLEWAGGGAQQASITAPQTGKEDR